jgi:hypothetical protein
MAIETKLFPLKLGGIDKFLLSICHYFPILQLVIPGLQELLFAMPSHIVIHLKTQQL